MSDDDIMDLTEVVKPGQNQQAATPDFGSDLDALLQDMGNAGGGKGAGELTAPAAAVAGPDLKSLGTVPSDGHVVNPNEDIDLPALSDLDALLAELGVENAPQPAAKPVDAGAGPQLGAAPEPELVFDELDAGSERGAEKNATLQSASLPDAQPGTNVEPLAASTQQQSAQPAAKTAQVAARPASGVKLSVSAQLTPAQKQPVQKPADQNQSVKGQPAPSQPAQNQAAPKPPAAAATAPISNTDTSGRITADADIEAIMAGLNEDPHEVPDSSGAPAGPNSVVGQGAPAKPATKAAPVGPGIPAEAAKAATAAETGGIDLDELDSMLDKVLLAAPKRAPKAYKAAAGGENAAQSVAAASAPITDAATANPAKDAPASGASAAPAGSLGDNDANDDDDDILDLEMFTVETDTQSAEPVEPAAPAQSVVSVVSDELIASATPKEQTAPAASVATAASAAPLAEAPVAQVNVAVPDLQAENTRLQDDLLAMQDQLAAVQAELASLRSGFEALQANLEKSAAQAAAKVIREELAGLAAALE